MTRAHAQRYLSSDGQHCQLQDIARHRHNAVPCPAIADSRKPPTRALAIPMARMVATDEAMPIKQTLRLSAGNAGPDRNPENEGRSKLVPGHSCRPLRPLFRESWSAFLQITASVLGIAKNMVIPARLTCICEYTIFVGRTGRLDAPNGGIPDTAHRSVFGCAHFRSGLQASAQLDWFHVAQGSAFRCTCKQQENAYQIKGAFFKHGCCKKLHQVTFNLFLYIIQIHGVSLALAQRSSSTSCLLCMAGC